MKWVILILQLVIPSYGVSYKATQGEVWPQVKEEDKGNVFYTYNSKVFKFKVINKDCDDLQSAINRCKDNIVRLDRITKDKRRYMSHQKSDHKKLPTIDIQKLLINMTQPCRLDYPYFGMDESYNLTVSKISILSGSSIWGIIRGLETFSQLFYIADDYKKVLICTTDIVDYPTYPHRGLMLDTSRHYVSVSNILRTLDAMAMNKLNVLHWHMTDDESFPYSSHFYPELSEKGAYFPSMIYSKSEIRNVKKYARRLGIRVIPEFNIPGHTTSWGKSHPEIITVCSDDNLGPMNPIKNETYDLLGNLFAEVQELFSNEEHLHLGGEDVNLECWALNPEIQQFMKDNRMETMNEVSAYFYKRVISKLRRGTPLIVRQQVFDDGVPLPNNTLVEINKNRIRNANYMLKLLRSSLGVIVTAPYYLNKTVNFEELYDCGDVPDYTTVLQNVVGGEVCVWTQRVDDTNLLSHVWPRASAVAEVLWSRPLGSCNIVEQSAVDVYRARRRLEEHWCRMRRRQIPAHPPSGAGYCIV